MYNLALMQWWKITQVQCCGALLEYHHFVLLLPIVGLQLAIIFIIDCSVDYFLNSLISHFSL